MSKISEKRQTTHKDLFENVAEGFEVLDDHILDKKAPKIRWEKGFENRPDELKIRYLKKLANTMNQAAKLIQDERDALVPLLVKKDEQIESMKKQVAQHQMVLQDQLTRLNNEKQQYNQEIARLSREIRLLKLENKNLKKAQKKEDKAS